MEDFAGNRLTVGMRVIYLYTGTSSSWMTWGRIVGFTPQKVRVRSLVDENNKRDTATLRFPDSIVIPVQPPDFRECGASSWPFTVNDSKCIRDSEHDGLDHLDIDLFAW